jgi:hypothetical protein
MTNRVIEPDRQATQAGDCLKSLQIRAQETLCWARGEGEGTVDPYPNQVS